MEPRAESRHSQYPAPTLVVMACALLSALALVDWGGVGTSRPAWMFALPILFGAAGSLMALARGAYSWATASAVLGLSLLPLLIIATTIIEGI